MPNTKQSDQIVLDLTTVQPTAADRAQVERDVTAIKTSLESYKINSAASYEQSAQDLLTAAALEKQITSVFGPAKKASKAAYDAMNDLFNTFAKPVKSFKDTVKAERRRFELAREEKRLAQIEKAEASGNFEKAEALAEKEVVPVSGQLTKRANWKMRITDKKAFVKACLEGKNGLSLDFLEPATSSLNALAKAEKSKFKAPGLEAFNDEIEVIG
jgi:hypothetical protein